MYFWLSLKPAYNLKREKSQFISASNSNIAVYLLNIGAKIKTIANRIVS